MWEWETCTILSNISKFVYCRKFDIVDSMIQKLEKYADNLENIVQQRTALLMDEKQKTDMLLYRMLPPYAFLVCYFVFVSPILRCMCDDSQGVRIQSNRPTVNYGWQTHIWNSKKKQKEIDVSNISSAISLLGLGLCIRPICSKNSSRQVWPFLYFCAALVSKIPVFL